MIERAYLEITNICNLSCSFCHKTKREKRMMSADEFDLLLNKLEGRIKYLYLHLMGEPLIHPLLADFIDKATKKGMGVIITTNGTLLSKRGDEIVFAKPHKVHVSLHAPEANGEFATKEYIDSICDFAAKSAQNGIFVILRLWNEGGLNTGNDSIISSLKEKIGNEWVNTRSGYRIADRIFIEHGECFDWPDLSMQDYGDDLFCYALRDQIGILCDGSVVPCCLDAEGQMTLGNLFDSDASLEKILSSPRAKKIYDSFTAHKACEELCRHCGYAAVTKKHRNKKTTD